MNHFLKTKQKALLEEAQERNQKVIVEYYKAEKTRKELALEFGISVARINQILKKGKVVMPLKQGYPKYERWKKRISEAKLKKQNGRPNPSKSS